MDDGDGGWWEDPDGVELPEPYKTIGNTTFHCTPSVCSPSGMCSETLTSFMSWAKTLVSTFSQ